MKQGSAADLSGVAQSSCFSRVLYIANRGAADLVEYCRSTSTVKQDVTAAPVKQYVTTAPLKWV